MTVNNELQEWEAPTLEAIRVSAEVTAYVATK